MCVHEEVIIPTCQQIGPVGYGHSLYYYYGIPLISVIHITIYMYLQRVVPQIAIKDEWWWWVEGAGGDGVVMQSLGPFPTRIVFFFWTKEVALN